MKINIVAVSKDPIRSYPEIASVLLNAVNHVADERISLPETYSDPSECLQQISELLKVSDVLLVMPSVEKYHDTKNLICKALHLETAVNSELEKIISENPDRDNLGEHTVMPVSSVVFPLHDGLYSSFLIRSSTQSIIFVPLCQDRTFLTMKKYIFPYFENYYDKKCPDFMYYETDYSSHIFEKNVPEDFLIAISDSDTLKSIRKFNIADKSLSAHFAVVPNVNERDIRDYREYAKTKAVSAADFLEIPYGAALIEDIDSTDGDYCVHIAVVNEKTTVLKTMCSIPDETYEDFLHSVVSELLLTVMSLASPDTAADENSEESSRVPVRSIKAWKIILCIAALAASCGLTYYAIELIQNGTFFFGL